MHSRGRYLFIYRMPIILPKTGMDQCISIKYTVDFDFMYIPRKKCESLQILFKEVYCNSKSWNRTDCNFITNHVVNCCKYQSMLSFLSHQGEFFQHLTNANWQFPFISNQSCVKRQRQSKLCQKTTSVDIFQNNNHISEVLSRALLVILLETINRKGKNILMKQ